MMIRGTIRPLNTRLIISSRGLGITKNFFMSAHLRNSFAEIAVADKICNIFPAAVLKHLYIFFFVIGTFRIIIQLIDHIFRLAFFQNDKIPGV